MKEYIKRQKEELGMTTEALSKLSGVPVGTINKILNGETKSPRYDTLRSLAKVLFADGVFPNNPEAPSQTADSTISVSYDLSPAGRYNSGVNENALIYRKKPFTITDYYGLPEDVRAELIDGELIYMEAPDYAHQAVISELAYLLTDYIRKQQGACKVLMSPLDVQLDCDEHTVLQPDMVISCKKEQRTKRGIYGAPDMVVEITSPSTRKRDFTRKMAKYAEAGVREYWIVDLQKKLVITYFFEDDMIPHVYSFDTRIPVSIFRNQCTIHFEEILRRQELEL